MADPAPPVLRIVRGNPDDVEVAALATVLAGLDTARAGAPAPPVRSRWSDPASRLRLPPRPGAGGWRASALPG